LCAEGWRRVCEKKQRRRHNADLAPRRAFYLLGSASLLAPFSPVTTPLLKRMRVSLSLSCKHTHFSRRRVRRSSLLQPTAGGHRFHHDDATPVNSSRSTSLPLVNICTFIAIDLPQSSSPHSQSLETFCRVHNILNF
jgi:hypothetical protein